jgi:hypothetical protein
MKIVDDYEAKLALWARDGRVIAMPVPVGIPQFGFRRFSSAEEMNKWKQELLIELARQGGVRWTS